MKYETVFPEISRPPYPSKIISMMPLHVPAFGTPCWNFPPWYNQLTTVDQCCHPRPAGLETLWSVGSFPCQWAQWLGLSLRLGSRHLSLKCSICSPDTTGYPASPKWTGKRKKERKTDYFTCGTFHLLARSFVLSKFSQETLSELSPYDACIHCCVWLWGLGLICCLTHCNLAQVISGHKIIAPNVHD